MHTFTRKAYASGENFSVFFFRDNFRSLVVISRDLYISLRRIFCILIRLNGKVTLTKGVMEEERFRTTKILPTLDLEQDFTIFRD